MNGFGIYFKKFDLKKAEKFILDVISRIKEPDITSDLAEIERSASDPTTRFALINARLGQGKFRADLEDIWENSCAVLEIQTRELLRASHIKPWRNSDNNERLDKHNGLLLSAHLDALFDKGLISFDENETILIAEGDKEFKKSTITLNIKDLKLRKKPNEETCKYLAWHRENVFKKQLDLKPN